MEVISNLPGEHKPPTNDELLAWGREILDDKIPGILVIVKTENVDGEKPGIKVEGRVSINKVDRMDQLRTIAALLNLEPEEALIMGMFLRKERNGER